MKVASLVEDGRFAHVENRAIGGRKCQGLEFLVKGEEMANEGFALNRDFDGDGGFHRTSVFRERDIPSYLNPVITTREVGYTQRTHRNQ